MVFVTGTTGLLGSHLLYHLLDSGHTVYALKRRASNIGVTREVFAQYPDGEECWKKVIWVDGDVLKPETLSEYIRKSTYVYHCAAVVSFTAADQDVLLQTNLKGTENVASLCLEYGVRLCYVSSIAALGDAVNPGELIDENTSVIEGREHSVYSQSKGFAEQIVWKYISYGLNAVIVCPSIILGAGLWNRSSAQLYLTAAKGIPFYTRGVTGYVDVRDVCEIMVRLAEDPLVKGERFILNGGNHSYQELFTLITRMNGKRPPRWYLRPWMTEVVWRLLAVGGKITGKKPAFTRETARSAHHCSFYSNAKILTLYPDFHFFSLADTLEHIRLMLLGKTKGDGGRQKDE